VVGKSLVIVERWSSQDSWVSRVEDWDRHQDRGRQHAFLEESANIGRRQAAEAAALQDALITPAVALLGRLEREQGDDPFSDWSLRDLMRASIAAAKPWTVVAGYERAVTGMTTEKSTADFLQREIQLMGREELIGLLASTNASPDPNGACNEQEGGESQKRS
jgi:hypothetical protein